MRMRYRRLGRGSIPAGVQSDSGRLPSEGASSGWQQAPSDPRIAPLPPNRTMAPRNSSASHALLSFGSNPPNPPEPRNDQTGNPNHHRAPDRRVGTLWLTDSGANSADHRPVETVSLGALSSLPPLVLPQDLVASGMVNALMLNEAFKTVSGFVRPSVVFIEVESGSARGFFRNRGGGALRQSAGSGVIISSEGYVVTNHHVIEDASRIRVTLSDKREYRAEVVGEDPNTDLAVIRLRDAEDLPAVTIGDSESLEVGEWVLAVGNPFRLTSTVTAGIVSALGRSVNIIDDSFGIESFIQTDAAINPGTGGRRARRRRWPSGDSRGLPEQRFCGTRGRRGWTGVRGRVVVY